MTCLVFLIIIDGGRADIIRDFKTGDSLCYAFIGEFNNIPLVSSFFVSQ